MTDSWEAAVSQAEGEYVQVLHSVTVRTECEEHRARGGDHGDPQGVVLGNLRE